MSKLLLNLFFSLLVLFIKAILSVSFLDSCLNFLSWLTFLIFLFIVFPNRQLYGLISSLFPFSLRFLDHFRVISSSIQLLVHDLENACEPALTAMTKVGIFLCLVVLMTLNNLYSMSIFYIYILFASVLLIMLIPPDDSNRFPRPSTKTLC